MSSTNRGAVRNNNDYYATPDWVTNLILPILKWNAQDIVMDPSAGDGAILRAVEAYGKQSKLCGFEIDPILAKQSNVICANALTIETWGKPNKIIMNPPFSLAQEFCERAISEVSKGGEVASLMRLAMLESRKREQFWNNNPCDIYVLGKRPSFTGGKTDSTAYAWFVWGSERGNHWWRLDK
ncbi:MAG: SAM-dependent methyltransferase [Bacteroidia bacterium]